MNKKGKKALRVAQQVSSQLAHVVKQNKLYKNNKTGFEYLLEGLKTITGLTSSNLTLSINSSNYKTGGCALQAVMTTAGGYTTIVKTVSWDVSDLQTLEIVFFISDPTQLTQLGFYFQNANGDYNYYFNSFRKGWNTLRINKDAFTKSGTIDWTQTMTSFTIRIVGASAQTPTLIIDSIKKNVIEDAPKFVLILDDGYSSAYSIAYPYLKNKGAKCTFAVIPSLIGTTGKMVSSNLVDLYTNGMDVLSHSYSHGDFSTYTYTQSVQDILKAKKFLMDLGIERGLDMFVYPVQYTDVAYTALKDLGFICARDSVGGYSFIPTENMLNIPSEGISDTSTINYVKGRLDKAKAMNCTFIAYLHDIADTPVTGQVATSLFQQMIDYAISLGFKFMTYSEWYESTLI